jgi:hypothetical protein
MDGFYELVRRSVLKSVGKKAEAREARAEIKSAKYTSHFLSVCCLLHFDR